MNWSKISLAAKQYPTTHLKTLRGMSENISWVFIELQSSFLPYSAHASLACWAEEGPRNPMPRFVLALCPASVATTTSITDKVQQLKEYHNFLVWCEVGEQFVENESLFPLGFENSFRCSEDTKNTVTSRYWQGAICNFQEQLQTMLKEIFSVSRYTFYNIQPGSKLTLERIGQ